MVTEPAVRPGSLAAALVRACHPEPTVAVSFFALVLALRAGDGARSPLVAAAVLGAQLCIGWTNDRLDAARDISSGRPDKPVASGALPMRVLDVAILLAVVITVVLSFLLGWRGGLANLWVLGWGLLYNLGLKSSVLSFLPYAAAFGALPAVATFSLPHPSWPALWVVTAGALLGIAANLTNVLPDLVDDRSTGVHGLPHRLGAQRSLLLAALLLVLVTASIVFGPPGGPSVVGWVGLFVVVAVVLGGLRAALRRPASRTSFVGILGVTALDLALIVITAHGLT